MSYNITSQSRCALHVIGIQYSSDGEPDTISIILDNDRFGQFITHSFSQSGHLWNVFKNSGLVGNTQILLPGEHTLTIRVTSTDEYGVELDMIRIAFSMCEGECPSVAPLHRPDNQNPTVSSNPPDVKTDSTEKANINTSKGDESQGDESEADNSGGGLPAGAIGGIFATIIILLLIIR